MAVEIERKFLVHSDDWRQNAGAGVQIVQGYISTRPEGTVRVRIKDEEGILTIKGRAEQLVRPEFEYSIPLEDARQMLQLCEGHLVEKRRFDVDVGDHRWVVDEFAGDNQGLVVAEIELDDPDETFQRPSWIGDEVTGQVRYYNARLAHSPYQQWDATPGDDDE